MPYAYDGDKCVRCVESVADLTSDLRCDGCDERCQLSMKLVVRGFYNHGDKKQEFYLKPGYMEPEMYVGNVKLNMGFNRPVLGYAQVAISNAESAYKTALAHCRRTCRHSKMR